MELSELYGADATEWLRRWDEGRSVWSVEMGGLGPGYEQAIQITGVEVLRHMLQEKYDYTKWDEQQDVWQRDLETVRKFGYANETIKKLGLSGAQWGAAVSLACCIYRRGPVDALTDQAIEDRKTQVSKNFPKATP